MEGIEPIEEAWNAEQEELTKEQGERQWGLHTTGRDVALNNAAR